jgi:hypothetical protein
MIYVNDTLYASKSHAIDVHSQTQALDPIAVSARAVAVDELAAALNADMILLASTMAILADVMAATFGTLHVGIPQLYDTIEFYNCKIVPEQS